MTTKQVSVVALVICVLISSVIAVVYIGGFKLTMVSISKVELQGGSEEGKKWVKGYWVITFTLDQYEEYKGYLEIPLEENTTAVTADGKEVYTNENVLIKIKPKRAYFTRPIQRIHTLVTQPAYKCGWHKLWPDPWYDTGVKADSVFSDHYEWAGDPEIHTVWTAEVYVEGVLVGTAEIDTKQGATTVTVGTNKGAVLVKNLGYLQGRYIPTWQDVIAFSRKYVYRYSDAYRFIPYDNGAIMQDHGTTGKLWIIKPGTSGAYSTYWYGITRWKDAPDLQVEGTPAGWEPDGLTVNYLPINAENYGGWLNKDETWHYVREPVNPVIFPEDEDDYHRPYMNLIEYLEHKGCGNVAEQLFPNADSWTLDTENMQVVVDLPWGAYYIPEGVLYVPTELADTWVYYPPVSDVKITAVGWETGESVREISGTARCWVDIVQKADVESSAKITAVASTPKAIVSPAEKTVTLEPDGTMRLYFDVQNLGVSGDTEGYVTFTVYETWANTVTSTNSNLKFKLLKPSEEATILDVLVIGKESQSAVGGITVYVYYEGQTKSGITSISGTCPFDLGTFRGTTTITTLATDVYKASTITKFVSGRSSVTVELIRQGAEPEPEPDWMLYVMITIIVSMAVVIAIITLRRKK